jgi:ABC-type nitrate/sulfonate/bicarbonate transport system permease component
MAATGTLTIPHRSKMDAVLVLRIAIIAALLVFWQLLSMSGLLYEDVVPGLPQIAAGLYRLLTTAEFYVNLKVTAGEILAASLIGGLTGMIAGLLLGGSYFMERAFERYFYYLGPTPKIIFFPLMIMWFGVGSGSKVAMGAVSCFFPVALAVAAGMRRIPPILIRVGQSFRANHWQMLTKIHLPAMREPVVNGFRLGFGVALIGVLLAETKLSNQGLGFLVIQNYQRFDMPGMYALLIAIFVLAVAVNALLGRLSRGGRRR